MDIQTLERARVADPENLELFLRLLSQKTRLDGTLQISSAELADVRARFKLKDPSGGQMWLPGVINEQGRIELIHRMTGMVFVMLPPGSYTMGDAGGDDDEQPAHEVVIETPQLCGKFPITQKQWRIVMGKNPSTFSNESGKKPKHLKLGEEETYDWDNHPVETVSWLDCQEFMKKTGLKLPPETGWEYACRAGTKERFHSAAHEQRNKGGSDEEHLKKIAVFGRDYDDGHAPVGSKQPNDWGIYDMLGNVWEWCQDEYHDSYVGAPPDARPWNSKWDELRTELLTEAVERKLLTQEDIDAAMGVTDDDAEEDSSPTSEQVDKVNVVLIQLIQEKRLEPHRTPKKVEGSPDPSGGS